jgi:tetratricopeptide (TPR) repeat protein
MPRVSLFLLCSLAALAQQAPRQDPLDAALQAAWREAAKAPFQQSAATREQVRSLLQHVPANAPRFPGWAQQVAQLYQNAGLNAEARSILQDALTRTAPLGEWHPSHIAALNALAESWQQDGNLLKAVAYLEQAAAAQAALPALTPQPAQGVTGLFVKRLSYAGGPSSSLVNTYTRLADLYRQLGRPDAVSAIAAKIRMLAPGNESAVAQFLEQYGSPEDAAAIFRKLAAAAADPQTKASVWQSLAQLYAGQERYSEAVDAMQQAIASAPESNSFPMGQILAGYMRRAGMLDQGDQVYQQLLQQSRGGPQEAWIRAAYALYLVDTDRSAQGQSLLEGYLEDSPALDAQQKMSILFNLANIADRTKDSKGAATYRQAAEALQPPSPPPPVGQVHVTEELQQAQNAANQHRFADAYDLAQRAIDLAPQAADGQGVEWLVPTIAFTLAAYNEPAKAEQLYQRLLATARSRSADNMQPLLQATESYAAFLLSRPDRGAEAPAAIEQYRRVLLDANGADSASLAQPLRMKITYPRLPGQELQVDASVRELLELQESLSGATSEPYFGDLQTAARAYESAGDFARALPLRRKAIAIADVLTLPNTGWRPAQTRMDAALLLARLGQFGEARTLGEEAVAWPGAGRQGPQLASQLEQIRRMEQAAAAASASRIK